VARDPSTTEALAAGNRAYEGRFGQVFLLCATGLTSQQILANLEQRLRNDPATESAVVADELRRIALVRLEKAVGEAAQP
jgi:2-oxo-4-hydroxy-4-carboxy-5-ureidoimidazoline decarboxylase